MIKTLTTPTTIGRWSIVKKRHSFSIATLAPPVDENRNSFFYRWDCLFTNALKKQVSPWYAKACWKNKRFTALLYFIPYCSVLFKCVFHSNESCQSSLHYPTFLFEGRGKMSSSLVWMKRSQLNRAIKYVLNGKYLPKYLDQKTLKWKFLIAVS